MRVSGLILLMAALAAAQGQPGGSASGSIQGTVVDSVTHQPVHEAVVSLAGDPDRQKVTTASGTFEIDNLQPGQYSLYVEHKEYPQRRSLPIAITAGGPTAPITLELVPFAAVSGRVLDEDGDPLPACSVHLQLARPPYQEVIAQQDFREVLGSSVDGEYRLDRIPPGRYILRAQCQAPVFEPRPLSAGPDPLPGSAYPTEFFPGANTAESAQAIELMPGQLRSGIDFRMKPAHVTHIKVKLSGTNWRGRKDLAWQLIPAEHRAPAIGLSGAQHYDWSSVWHDVETTNGEFEIPKVFPGSYRLLVSTNMRFTESRGFLGGSRQIAVGDAPMEVELALQPPMDLNGTIEMASGAKAVPLDQVSVELAPDYPNFFPKQGAQTKADGSFTVKSAFPGPAHINIIAVQRCGVGCIQDAVFLKSARLGGAELTDGLLDLSSAAGGDLRIVVSSSFATIQGMASAFAVVTASAQDARGFRMNELNTNADQNGRFKFDNVVPGKYRLDLRDQLASDGTSGGQEVTLQEGQTLSVELRPSGAQ